jgi:hypothetical protein
MSTFKWPAKNQLNIVKAYNLTFDISIIITYNKPASFNLHITNTSYLGIGLRERMLT